MHAKNYIQFPAKSGGRSRGLNLIGSHCYIAFRPAPSKTFVLHLDLLGPVEDDITFRISFSNMYKAAKIGHNQAQFPFHVAPAPGSVDGRTGSKGTSGPAPKSTRWTMFIIDMKKIMKVYFNRRYSELKGVKICSACSLKGIYTSSVEYDPATTISAARKSGIKSVSENLTPMPREMNYIVAKGKVWSDLYELVRFPAEAPDIPADVAQKSEKSQKEIRVLNPRPPTNTNTARTHSKLPDSSKPAVPVPLNNVPSLQKIITGNDNEGKSEVLDVRKDLESKAVVVPETKSDTLMRLQRTS